LRVNRYIHLNPVAAKICDTPDEYLWFSYRYFLNKKICPKWLITEIILSYFDIYDSHAYAEFISEGIDDNLTEFYCILKSMLGSDIFISNHLNRTTDLLSVN